MAADVAATAIDIADRIRASADKAWNENEHETPEKWDGFHRRNGALWREAEAAGPFVYARVCAIVDERFRASARKG